MIQFCLLFSQEESGSRTHPSTQNCCSSQDFAMNAMKSISRFILCLCLLAASTKAFQPLSFASSSVSIKTRVEAVQVSKPHRTAGRTAFLGVMIGRVANRIIDHFLSDERKETNFPSTVPQAVFLIGAMEIMSGKCTSPLNELP